MLKNTRLVISIFLLFSVFSAPAWCQEKSTGIGIILGEPTGFSWKMWLDGKIAYDSGIAWSFTGEPHIHIQGDVLWHNFSFLQNIFEIDDSNGWLPFYYGIGGILKVGNDAKLGARFVIGTTYILKNAPFDIFFETAPVMDVIPGTKFGMSVALGSRFWF